MFGSLYEALTWHTAIEVVAIVFTGFIVHPYQTGRADYPHPAFSRLSMRLIERWSERLLLKLHLVSRKSSRKRIIKLSTVYKEFLSDRDWMMNVNHVAVLYSSRKILDVIVQFLIGICVGIFVPVVGHIAGFLIIVIATYHYVRTALKLDDLVYSIGFKKRIMDQMLNLRKIADFDADLSNIWLDTFNEPAPFTTHHLE